MEAPNVQFSYFFLDSCNLTAHSIYPNKSIWDGLAWTAIFLIFALGNTSALFVIHFERFGGDWQKRGLNNRLYSNAIVAIMALNNTVIILWIIWMAEIDCPLLYIFLTKIARAAAVSVAIFMTVNTCVTFWQAYVWLSIKEMNDQLLDKAITTSTYGISLTISLFLPIHQGTYMYTIKCQE